jgi:hypothetical protein
LPVDYIHTIAEAVYLYSMLSRDDVELISEQVQAALKEREGEIRDALQTLTAQDTKIEKQMRNIKVAIREGVNVEVFAADLKELSEKRKEIQQMIEDRKRDITNADDSLASLVARTSIDKVSSWFAAEAPEKRALLHDLITGRMYGSSIYLSTKTNRHYKFPARRANLDKVLTEVVANAKAIADLKGEAAHAALILMDEGLERIFEDKYRVDSLSEIPADLLMFAAYPVPPKYFDYSPKLREGKAVEGRSPSKK